MEAMGTSDFSLIAAFFIGLMVAISPCPLATNITAIAYISKKINNGRTTLITSFVYTLGRMFTYVSMASLIVYIGVNIQASSLFLQSYGEKILGPLLVFVGLVMLDIIKLPTFKGGSKFEKVKEKLSEKGYLGSFLLGIVFALTFCPISGVLFFGMLIPLSLKFSDGLLIPSVFAFATGLPVIIFSLILVYSVSKIGKIMHKMQIIEKYIRHIAAVVFILIGLYYIWSAWF
ncbi:MAG: aromatic aminobenezylarsenical efflux permease ArsG family transporter [Candidatus Aenigmarchaeota archaeon]|nr:aromatic aminobenezylarsenical efflux permease ArsG family transporter [Candidatus Aenigmarchaeota archaeon]